MNQRSPEHTPNELAPMHQGRSGDTAAEVAGPSFDWEALVPRVVHPLKVAIIEAFLWIDTPMSASELTKVFDNKIVLAGVSYHLTKLFEVEALVKVGDRQVRGALQTFYFFPGRDWESGSGRLDPA